MPRSVKKKELENIKNIIKGEEEIFKFQPFELLKNFLSVMTAKKFEIFKLICEKPGLSISEIKNELGLPKSTISTTISSFKKLKLVETKVTLDEKNKRVKVLVYPNVETLSLITKELEILYIKARKARMEK